MFFQTRKRIMFCTYRKSKHEMAPCRICLSETLNSKNNESGIEFDYKRRTIILV